MIGEFSSIENTSIACPPGRWSREARVQILDSQRLTSEKLTDQLFDAATSDSGGDVVVMLTHRVFRQIFRDRDEVLLGALLPVLDRFLWREPTLSMEPGGFDLSAQGENQFFVYAQTASTSSSASLQTDFMDSQSGRGRVIWTHLPDGGSGGVLTFQCHCPSENRDGAGGLGRVQSNLLRRRELVCSRRAGAGSSRPFSFNREATVGII